MTGKVSLVLVVSSWFPKFLVSSSIVICLLSIVAPSTDDRVFDCLCEVLIDRDKVFSQDWSFWPGLNRNRDQYSIYLNFWCNRQYFNITSLW